MYVWLATCLNHGLLRLPCCSCCCYADSVHGSVGFVLNKPSPLRLSEVQLSATAQGEGGVKGNKGLAGQQARPLANAWVVQLSGLLYSCHSCFNQLEFTVDVVAPYDCK